MRLLLAILLTTLLVPSALAGNAPSGFVPLFDGKTLDGWVVTGNPEGFTVLDGCIHSDGGKGGRLIRTDRPYGNFILRLEFMLSERGNSGIFLRGSDSDRGFEVQLSAPGRDDSHCTGSIYGRVPVNPRPDETPLRWHAIEITAAYKHIEVMVDGVKVCEGDYDQVPSMKDLRLAGYVGMQDSHSGTGRWVKFRNIEINDLDQDPSFVAEGLVSSDPAIRRVAYDAAVGLGPPMVMPLLDIVVSADETASHTAEMALARIVGNASAPGADAQADQVRVALLDRVAASRDASAPERVLAARLLGLVGRADRRTIAVLTEAVLEGGQIGGTALEGLGRIPGRAVTNALIEILPAADRSQQPGILLALGARGDVAAFPALADAARNRAGHMRLAAVQALGLLGSAKAVPILAQTGRNASTRIRAAAVEALLAIADADGVAAPARRQALRAARELTVSDTQ
ncbi:MAG: DUF1080 domain-containing protein [Armatimonadota bacterium]|nr:MAG: DUF1080 domain-containing protein [Armatimonadota bacterium]